MPERAASSSASTTAAPRAAIIRDFASSRARRAGGAFSSHARVRANTLVNNSGWRLRSSQSENALSIPFSDHVATSRHVTIQVGLKSLPEGRRAGASRGEQSKARPTKPPETGRWFPGPPAPRPPGRRAGPPVNAPRGFWFARIQHMPDIAILRGSGRIVGNPKIAPPHGCPHPPSTLYTLACYPKRDPCDERSRNHISS